MGDGSNATVLQTIQRGALWAIGKKLFLDVTVSMESHHSAFEYHTQDC